MTEPLTKIVFLLVGLINFVPIMGVMGPSTLGALYGVEVGDDATLTLLMQHRAMLFGILGGFILLASFRAGLRTPAMMLGYLSMLGFIVLYLGSGSPDALTNIFWTDVAGCVLFAVPLLVARLNAGQTTDPA
ncbi:phosphopantetheine adenylyltransferase [Kordiimonas sp.]|uniref:phosphopantetheine adenylyltransferase n=1 Tax=Kordiimonas sp. TaxID=1970157 RepID=UPI003A8D5886